MTTYTPVVLRAFGVESLTDLHRADLDQLLGLLERRPRVRKDTPTCTLRRKR